MNQEKLKQLYRINIHRAMGCNFRAQLHFGKSQKLVASERAQEENYRKDAEMIISKLPTYASVQKEIN